MIPVVMQTWVFILVDVVSLGDFKTVFLYVASGVLELPHDCLCLPKAHIKGMQPHHIGLK